MRRLVFALSVLLITAAPARAVTIRDIIDLTRAGLGDEVLLALIEVDGGVFPVDPQTLTRLKEAGVSEQVIVALVRSGRAPAATQPADAVQTASQPPEPVAAAQVPAEPVTVVREVEAPVTVVREVEVPVPYYVTVPVVVSPSRHGHDGHDSRAATSPFTPPPAPYQTDRPADPRPVYWGSGGKLRPDAWNPGPTERPSPERRDGDRRRR
jgi:hypothetical protein